MAVSLALSCIGNWSVNRRQFSSPTCALNPCSIFVNISLRSSFGCDQDATASQKNMKSETTPLGFTWIIWQMPRNAESFSSLSRMFRSEVHLPHCKVIRRSYGRDIANDDLRTNTLNKLESLHTFRDMVLRFDAWFSKYRSHSFY